MYTVKLDFQWVVDLNTAAIGNRQQKWISHVVYQRYAAIFKETAIPYDNLFSMPDNQAYIPQATLS